MFTKVFACRKQGGWLRSVPGRDRGSTDLIRETRNQIKSGFPRRDRLPCSSHSVIHAIFPRSDDNPAERRSTNSRGSRHCPDLDTAFGLIIPVHSQDAHSSTSFSPAPRLLHLDLPRRHDTLGIVCGVAIKVSQRPGREWWRIMSYMSAVSSCLLLVPVVLLVG